MSEDLTKKLPGSDSEKLNLILTTVQSVEGRLEKLELRVDNIDSRLERLELRVDNIDSRLERLEVRVDNIDSQLQRLDQKVELRLYDTRPIWHKVVADIGQLQTGQDAMREEMRELNSTAREVSRDQIVINDVIRKIHLDFHKIDERLHRLEVNRN